MQSNDFVSCSNDTCHLGEEMGKLQEAARKWANYKRRSREDDNGFRKPINPVLKDVESMIIHFFRFISPKLSKAPMEQIQKTLGLMSAQDFAEYRLAAIFKDWHGMADPKMLVPVDLNLQKQMVTESVFESLLKNTHMAERLKLLERARELNGKAHGMIYYDLPDFSNEKFQLMIGMKKRR